MKNFGDSLKALGLVSLLSAVYFAFFVRFMDFVEMSVHAVKDIPSALYITLAVLIALGGAAGLYVIKATHGEVRWPSFAGLALGVGFLVLAITLAALAYVNGVNSAEGMSATIMSALAILAGVALTTVSALLLADRMRTVLQSTSGAVAG